VREKKEKQNQEVRISSQKAKGGNETCAIRADSISAGEEENRKKANPRGADRKKGKKSARKLIKLGCAEQTRKGKKGLEHCGQFPLKVTRGGGGAKSSTRHGQRLSAAMEA